MIGSRRDAARPGRSREWRGRRAGPSRPARARGGGRARQREMGISNRGLRGPRQPKRMARQISERKLRRRRRSERRSSALRRGLLKPLALDGRGEGNPDPAAFGGGAEEDFAFGFRAGEVGRRQGEDDGSVGKGAVPAVEIAGAQAKGRLPSPVEQALPFGPGEVRPKGAPLGGPGHADADARGIVRPIGGVKGELGGSLAVSGGNGGAEVLGAGGGFGMDVAADAARRADKALGARDGRRAGHRGRSAWFRRDRRGALGGGRADEMEIQQKGEGGQGNGQQRKQKGLGSGIHGGGISKR